MIRYIHAADLHLDTPFSGIEKTSKKLASKLRDATFQSFKNIINLSIDEEVDFVLLAGDLYNTHKTNIQAQNLFIEQLQRLENKNIPVFLIYGNHDYLTPEIKKMSLPLPNNVYTFTEEVETHIIQTQTNQRVAISGFSYDSQWIFDRKIKEYPYRKENVDMHIGLLHGNIDQGGNSEKKYAPFTITELSEKNYDYWALGHIHQREQVSKHPFAVYPGNIQGLHRNELGKKGCLVVDWTKEETKINFVSTAPITWDTIQLNLMEIDSISELIQALNQQLKKQNIENNTLLHLTIKLDGIDNQDLLAYLNKAESSQELTQQLNAENIWIVSIETEIMKRNKKKSLEQLHKEEWSNSLKKALERQFFDEYTEDIFNKIPKRYLSRNNTKEYREEMLKKAIDKIHVE